LGGIFQREIKDFFGLFKGSLGWSAPGGGVKTLRKRASRLDKPADWAVSIIRAIGRGGTTLASKLFTDRRVTTSDNTPRKRQKDAVIFIGRRVISCVIHR